MTKRLTTALLCVVASFAIGGVATAQAKPLSYKTAKGLAKRLAEKQVRGRDVVSYHLTLPERVSASQIVFQYDDRTTSNVFCTALVIVKQTVSGRFTTIRARFSGQDCRGIPAEALEFEEITRRAQRQLRANSAATIEEVEEVGRSAKRCSSLRIPRTRRDEAAALFDIALVQALARTNDAAVGEFAEALVEVDARNDTLAAGAVAWADYVATIRALPEVETPCGALKVWARNGFTDETAPIDFAAYRALDRRAAVDQRAIGRAARELARLGVFPNAVVGFTPEGLFEQLTADAGITGGKGKIALG